jgi:hypothetical protein
VPPKRTVIKPGQKLELDLTPADRRAILENLTLLPPEYEAQLKKVHPEQPLLLTLDDLEDFSGYVAAESNHTTNKKLQKVLDSAFEKMTALLDKFTDEEPPVQKTTKKAQAAEREEAERKKQISEQAAFLATWAASVLQAAGKQGAKSRVLETFVPGKLEKSVLVTLEDVTPAVRKRLATGGEDYTLAEVGGMLMAVAGELCVAPVPLQIGLLMVAKSLMTAMQDWVGETMADGMARKLGPDSRLSMTTKRTPAKKKPAKSRPGPRGGSTWGPAKPQPTGTVYQFRIRLLGVHPPVWRRIQVRDCFLDELHHHIQAAMGWTNSHLYMLEIDDLVYGRPSTYGPDDEGRIIDASGTLLSTVIPKAKPGARPSFSYRYTYDMGDNWEHEVLFEGICEPAPRAKFPVCLEGERACPPENCGGDAGYHHLLCVLQDPEDEEYDEMLEWVGEDFDPEMFDAKIATVRMIRG